MTDSVSPKIWLGILAYMVSLLGTLLLSVAHAQLWAGLFLIGAGVLAVIASGRVKWSFSFAGNGPSTFLPHQRVLFVSGIGAICLLLLGANAYQAANPSNVFGLAGWLWLACMGALLGWTAYWSSRENVVHPIAQTFPAGTTLSWVSWEKATFAFIVLLAFAIRVWNLRDYPNNIYPDEIMTGTVATQSFLVEKPSSVFSTVWGDVELPALWFLIVSIFLRVGGTLLEMVRLPAALFGAATVIPFYFLIRETWGRVAAVTGATILAFSASNVHYSRLGLNNITTQFFWVCCFLFLLRGLREKRLINWTLAGLFAGLSEHFYYGTRLLPFIITGFAIYLFLVHRRKAKQYVAYFTITALGYLVGMGPLFAYFVKHPGLYLGRGVHMLVWDHIPTGLEDMGRMLCVLGPILFENILGISTKPSQDIIYFGSLLRVPEAALLTLGVGLLVWNWKHPAAFLLLLSGLGVLFVGGSLVTYPNSVPPLINHWTPAFPFFYCALAIPVGLFLEKNWGELSRHLDWSKPVGLCFVLALLGWFNMSYYFGSYHANPDLLRSESYKSAQNFYEPRIAISRFIESLGPGFAVAIIGTAPATHDSELTHYLVGSPVSVVNVPGPLTEGPIPGLPTTKVAFIFFPGNEPYQATIRDRYPGGRDGIFTGESGKLVFSTYSVGETVL